MEGRENVELLKASIEFGGRPILLDPSAWKRIREVWWKKLNNFRQERNGRGKSWNKRKRGNQKLKTPFEPLARKEEEKGDVSLEREGTKAKPGLRSLKPAKGFSSKLWEKVKGRPRTGGENRAFSRGLLYLP